MRSKTVAAALPLLALVGAAAEGRGQTDGVVPENAARAHVDTVRIADPDAALTFARTGSRGARTVLGVTRYRDGKVEGVDLSAALGRNVGDPVALFHELGYDRLRDLIAGAEAAYTTVPATQLVAPLDLGDHHIAAGTNYPAHAGEADVEGGPFLFPKLVAPTGPYAPVAAGDALLDYEVELAFVTLAPLRAGERAASVGLVLCNDYTDRATLLRHVDPSDVRSGKGFTTGKSFPGYLPVGNLLVVPRDFRRFAGAIELRLYANGELRQSSQVSAAIWDFDALVGQTWAQRATRWEHDGTRVGLIPFGEAVPARTLILSGTPSGTVFRGVTLGQKLRGVGAWLLGGWARSVPAHVIDAYVREARAGKAYLQPGDRVTVHADFLGVIDNPIVDQAPGSGARHAARRSPGAATRRVARGSPRARPHAAPAATAFFPEVPRP